MVGIWSNKKKGEVKTKQIPLEAPREKCDNILKRSSVCDDNIKILGSAKNENGFSKEYFEKIVEPILKMYQPISI